MNKIQGISESLINGEVMTDQLKGKVALITGAGSGIGKATAKLFAKEKAIVFLADINEKTGSQVTDEINNEKGTAFFISLDITSETAWQKAISQIEQQSKQLNILVNNAGMTLSMPILDMTLEMWRRVMATNLDSVFIGSKAALPLMQKTANGSIINISSSFGLVGNANSTAYCASKGAVCLFTKALAMECGKYPNPIRCNTVCPGIVATPMWKDVKWWPDFVKEQGSEEAAWRAVASQKTAIGRFAAPEEIAQGVLFLASDASSYLTGSDLVIDGGITAQ